MVLSSNFLFAQEKSVNNWFIGGSYHYGFIHPVRMSIKYNVKDHVRGIELYAGRQAGGDSFWDKLYRYPSTGLAYYYGTLANDEVFGRAHGLYPYFSSPLVKKGKYSAGYLIGTGVAYITNIYDLESNYLNLAISTHLNSFLKFALYNEYRVSENFIITNELVMTHYSNGRITSPNKGLNQVTANIGLKYFPDNRQINRETEIPAFTGHNELSVVSGYASKVIDHFNTGRYNALLLSIDYSRSLSHKRKLLTGIDFAYDGSLKRLISEDTGQPAVFSDALRIGLHAGQEVSVYDVGITLQLGVYLYNKWKNENHFIYQRYGIRYYISDSLFCTAILKAHLGVADYLVWGAGYIF